MDADDYALALQLQSQFYDDDKSNDTNDKSDSRPDLNKSISLVDQYWEVSDPNPDIRALFLQFNERFFWGRLAGIEVKWSPRMTLCAGICCYERRGGLCSVRLSVPLLKLRPRKDLVETLLHEMIHAYLFVTDNNKDHDGHGPEFHKHMYRINKETGTNISVYHNFHDEVEACRGHWWKCDGPCQSRKPYFGYVKRSMNRAPSKNDTWWSAHQSSCGGTYTKVKEPENYGKKKSKNEKDGKEDENKKQTEKVPSVKNMDIRVFGGEGKTLGGQSTTNGNQTASGSQKPPIIPGRPKPTATVTSDSEFHPKHKSPSTNNIPNKGNNPKLKQPKLPFLSGAKTPKKPVKNKPVSQGGSAQFDPNKVKAVFIDSDSDDDLLGSMSLNDSSRLINTSSNDNKLQTSSSEQNFGDSKGDIVESNSNNPEKSANDSESSGGKADDVRAMLRKVWGQKQLNGISGVKNKFTPKLTDISSGKMGNKRVSSDSDSDSLQANKKLKVCEENKTLRTNYLNQGSYIGGASSFIEDNNFPVNNNGVPSNHEKNGKTNITSIVGNFFNTEHVNGVKKSDKTSSTSVVADTNISLQGSSSVPTPTQNIELSSCPICNKKVPLSEINDHLDLCLTLQAIS